MHDSDSYHEEGDHVFSSFNTRYLPRSRGGRRPMNFVALSTSERFELSVGPEPDPGAHFHAIGRTYLEVLEQCSRLGRMRMLKRDGRAGSRGR